MTETKEKTLESFYENGIERRSWTVYPIANVAIKKCDKSFFDGNSTGLPKKDVCDFFGIDYTFRKKEIFIIFNEKKYRGYLMTKNDSSNRSILAWYQDLGMLFKKYYSNNSAVCFRKQSDNEFLIDILSDIDNDYKSFDEEDLEGNSYLAESIRYERSARNRKNAILIHGLNCQACGFNFEKKYGELGKKFIEVHHLIPLYVENNDRIVNPETDLVCLCSNCHRMIHRINNVDYDKTLTELKKIISNNNSK